MFHLLQPSRAYKDKDLFAAIKNMNLIKDQKGILRRYKREHKNWTTHLVNTKKFILKQIEEKKYKTIRILGSGYLLDVPLTELALKCDQLELIDIIHPKESILKCKNIKNIRLEHSDISGGILKEIFSKTGQELNNHSRQDFLQSLKAKVFTPSTEADLVISANILSQIPMFIDDYISKYNIFNKDERNELRKAIQQQHINYLQSRKSILISDFEEEYYDEDKKLAGVNPVLFTTIEINKTRKEWKWNFDNNFLYKEDFITKMNVLGQSFNL